MKRNSRCNIKSDLKKSKLDNSEVPALFNDLLIHIEPFKFGPGRLKILQKNVEKWGGILYENAPQDPERVSHVIVEESVVENDLEKINLSTTFHKATFLKCSWLIRCIKSKSYNEPLADDLLSKKQILDEKQDNKTKTSPNIAKVIMLSDVTKASLSDITEGPLYEMRDAPLCDVTKTIQSDLTETKSTSSLNTQNEDLFNKIKCENAASNNNSILKSGKLISQNFLEQLTTKSNIFLEKFACAHSSHTAPINLNSHITEELEKLSSAYENKKDTWRVLGYQKAIAAIKNYPKKIESWEDAKSIRGVGERLADKIKEIIDSGQLRKVKEVCDNEENQVLQLFIGVWGAGASTANNWYTQGFRTLDDLRRKASLTRHQQIGLEYYEELIERMLRPEVEEIANQVCLAVKKINPGIEITVCGSYRRGKTNCGDVDILITHPDGHSHSNIFRALLNILKETEFLTDDLVIQENNGNQQKYLGVCKLPGELRKHRRLDIIVVPYNEYAPAIMYFTGSAHFNRSMRLLATKFGMSLSEHGLRAGIVRDGKDHVTGGTLLDTPTEESIFQYLGLKYRPPNERSH